MSCHYYTIPCLHSDTQVDPQTQGASGHCSAVANLLPVVSGYSNHVVPYQYTPPLMIDTDKTAEQETVCLCFWQLRYSAFHRHFQVTKTVTPAAVLKRELLPMGLIPPKKNNIYLKKNQFRYICKYQLALDPISWVWLPAETKRKSVFQFFFRNTCTDSSICLSRGPRLSTHKDRCAR